MANPMFTALSSVRAVAGLRPGKLPTVFQHLDEACADILAFTAFFKDVWQQFWSNYLDERLNREIRRCIYSVGVFPNRDASIRLIRAVLGEHTDEWAEGRRYLGAARTS